MKLSGILADKGIEIFDGDVRYHNRHAVTRLWIVVANTEKAQIYRKIISDGVELIASAQAPHEERFGRPPVGDDKTIWVTKEDRATHSLDAHTWKDKKDEAGFVTKLAAWLDEAQKEDAFDRLVLVAGSQTLDALRSLLSEAVQARLMAQLDKDLAGLPDPEIQKQLAKIVWF